MEAPGDRARPGDRLGDHSNPSASLSPSIFSRRFFKDFWIPRTCRGAPVAAAGFAEKPWPDRRRTNPTAGPPSLQETWTYDELNGAPSAPPAPVYSPPAAAAEAPPGGATDLGAEAPPAAAEAKVRPLIKPAGPIPAGKGLAFDPMGAGKGGTGKGGIFFNAYA